MAVLAAIGAAIASIVIAFAWTQIVRDKIRRLMRSAEILQGEVEELEAEKAKLKASAQFDASAQ